MSSDPQLYEDTFTITSVDSAKYDRVSRITCMSADNTTALSLDVNTELYPCATNEHFQLVLASTLSLDGTKDDDKGWREVGFGEQTLANEFDYVCHGKVYRFEDGEENM
jgi:DNA-directed RNA polymerases I, II, and III subunit RPABC3